METATPELPGRGGAAHASLLAGLSANKQATTTAKSETAAGRAAPSTSPFSVTYTTAPFGQRTAHQEARPSADVAAHLSAASRAAPSSSTQVSTRAGGGRDLSATRVSTQVHVGEPSALAFLSPQSKAARPPAAAASASSFVDSREGSSQLREARAAVLSDNDDDGDSDKIPTPDEVGYDTWVRSERHRRSRAHDTRRSSSSAPLFVAPAPASASPSRSLYSDVEAARQSSQCVDRDGYASSPSLITADADASFMEDSGENDDDDAVDNARKHNEAAARHRSGDLQRPQGLGSRTSVLPDNDDKAVPAEEVKALIAAALRRYEKQRDAEEEAVLQQVSEEVEAQAARYASLVEVYNSACSDNAQLQEKLAASTTACAEMEQALQNARQMQQAQRESMKRLEVELYHSRDSQQHALVEQLAKSEEASADREALRRRYEKRQATLEAQLSMLREELAEKDARIAELTRQTEKHDDEMRELQQRTAQRETAVADEYEEIHQRMLRLGQNMSGMESALRERETTIAQLREQLAEATAVHRDHDHDVRQWQEEKQRLEAELASTQESLRKHTEDIRKRMSRLTSLEQQRDALKSEVTEARQALSTASAEQARVLKSVEEAVEEVRRLASVDHRRSSPFHPSAVGKPQSAPREQRDGSAEGRGRAAPHPDETLVYEDDDEIISSANDDAATASACSRVSDAPTMDSLMSGMSEEDEEEEEGGGDNEGPRAAGENRKGRPRGTTSRQPRPRTTAATPAAPSDEAAAPGKSAVRGATGRYGGGGAKILALAEKEQQQLPVRRLAQMLHHSAARAQSVVRELRRWVAALARQQRRQRRSSPSDPTSRRSTPTTGSASALVVGTAGTRRGATTGLHLPLVQHDGDRTSSKVNQHDMVEKLEQACRYLKSQLTAAKAALSESQAECQWRALSMQKWETDMKTARREVLSLEKERLTFTADREMLEAVRQELEAQLAESQKACAEATEKCEVAQAALEEMKATQASTQQTLVDLSSAKDAAEAAVEREQSKAARLTSKVEELTALHASRTDELAVLTDKHKAALSQLQAFRAQEATQQLRDQQESRSRSSELAELRTALAQLRVAEGAWEGERSRLQSTVSALRHHVEVFQEEVEAGGRRCAALEAEAVLQSDLEKTTLLTIASVVQSSPLTWAESKLRGGDVNGGGSGASPTEKKLFDTEEPSVEEVVVEEDGEALTTAVRAKLYHPPPPLQSKQRTSSHPSNTPANRGKKRNLSSTAQRLTADAHHAKAMPRPLSASVSTTPSSQHHQQQQLQEQHLLLSTLGESGAGASTSALLAQLRQHVVAAVQRMALEVVRLRTAAGHASLAGGVYSSSASVQPQKVPQYLQSPTTPLSKAGMTSATAHDATSSSPLERQAVPLMDHSDFFAAPSTALQSNPGSRPRVDQHPKITTTMPCTIAERRDQPSAASPPSPQQPWYGAGGASPPLRQHKLSPSVTHSPATEHVYNVSPWTPSRGLRSPSLRPPAAASVETSVAMAAKVWSEVRRSSSMEDGLSAGSHSSLRGDVDGSGSPARPPSLRANSLVR
jgi:hypothetical protein